MRAKRTEKMAEADVIKAISIELKFWLLDFVDGVGELE